MKLAAHRFLHHDLCAAHHTCFLDAKLFYHSSALNTTYSDKKQQFQSIWISTADPGFGRTKPVPKEHPFAQDPPLAAFCDLDEMKKKTAESQVRVSGSTPQDLSLIMNQLLTAHRFWMDRTCMGRFQLRCSTEVCCRSASGSTPRSLRFGHLDPPLIACVIWTIRTRRDPGFPRFVYYAAQSIHPEPISPDQRVLAKDPPGTRATHSQLRELQGATHQEFCCVAGSCRKLLDRLCDFCFKTYSGSRMSAPQHPATNSQNKFKAIEGHEHIS